MADPIEIMARAIERTWHSDDETAAEQWQDELTQHNRKIEAVAALSALTAAGYAVVPIEPSDLITAVMARELEQWDRRFDSAETIAHNAYIAAVDAGSIKLGEE